MGRSFRGRDAGRNRPHPRQQRLDNRQRSGPGDRGTTADGNAPGRGRDSDVVRSERRSSLARCHHHRQTGVPRTRRGLGRYRHRPHHSQLKRRAHHSRLKRHALSRHFGPLHPKGIPVATPVPGVSGSITGSSHPQCVSELQMREELLHNVVTRASPAPNHTPGERSAQHPGG